MRKGGKLRSLPVDRLERGELQPRRVIDGMALSTLARSIQAEGVLQPIFVRKKPRGRFEIIAGERRWRAAKMAGLQQIPGVVSNVSDDAALALALVENLHREDLNPLDQAVALRRLIDDFGLTHQQVATTIGRSRAAVSNLLRLLDLPDSVQEMVADGELDMGHARALLSLPVEEQEPAAKQVAGSGMSVREIEALARVARHAASSDEAAATKARSRPRPVSIQRRPSGSFDVRFSFSSRDELERAIERLRTFADDRIGQ